MSKENPRVILIEFLWHKGNIQRLGDVFPCEDISLDPL